MLVSVALCLLSLTVSTVALPEPQRYKLPPLDPDSVQNAPYAGDDSGFTPYDGKVRRWPLAPVEGIFVDASHSKYFPHMNLNIRHYHNASCGESPMHYYQFLNGTVANATYADHMNDLKLIFDPFNQTAYDLYLGDTLAIAMDLYRWANDTIGWLNFTETPGTDDSAILPGESLLPIPSGWPIPETKQRRAPPANGNDNGKGWNWPGNRSWFDTARWGSSGQLHGTSSGTGGDQDTEMVSPFADVQNEQDVENQLVYDPPDDSPPTEHHTHGPIGLAPDPQSRPMQQPQEAPAIPRTRKDRVWDGWIIVIGSAFGTAVAYGMLEAGTHVYPVNRKPELSNMFGAFGLAVGIITGVVIGVIQSRRWDASLRERERFNAGELSGLRTVITGLRGELRQMRSDMAQTAVQAARDTRDVITPSRSTSDLVGLVAKPIKDLPANTKVMIKKTASGLNTVGSGMQKASSSASGGLQRASTSVAENLSGMADEMSEGFGSMKDMIKQSKLVTKIKETVSSSGSGGDEEIVPQVPERDLPSSSSAPAGLNTLSEDDLAVDPSIYTEQMQEAISGKTVCRIPEDRAEEEAEQIRNAVEESAAAAAGTISTQ